MKESKIIVAINKDEEAPILMLQIMVSADLFETSCLSTELDKLNSIKIIILLKKIKTLL